MQCPACQIDLALAERQGIEIDYCPKCRGVWLDRGELDKIVERSAAASAPEPAPTLDPPLAPPAPARRQSWNDDSDDDHFRGDPRQQGGYQGPPPEGPYGYQRKRKGSWLGELFDFD